jgi:hypothetical protein
VHAAGPGVQDRMFVTDSVGSRGEHVGGRHDPAQTELLGTLSSGGGQR